jgi:phage shock protein A
MPACEHYVRELIQAYAVFPSRQLLQVKLAAHKTTYNALRATLEALQAKVNAHEAAVNQFGTKHEQQLTDIIWQGATEKNTEVKSSSDRAVTETDDEDEGDEQEEKKSSDCVEMESRITNV